MIIDESLTAKGYTPAAQVPAVFGQERVVRSITVHHWGSRGQTHDGVVAFFCTTGPGSTSAHYVASAGRVHCIVNPDDAAWHAGNATGNATSVGIECRPEATDGDYATVAELIRYLRGIYGDVPLRPHSSWSATACPGVWDLDRLDRLARAGTVTTQSAPTTESKEWYEMPIPKAELDKISTAVWQMKGLEGEAGQVQTMWRTLVDLAKESRQNTATIAGLTRALSAGTGLTEDQITDAVKAAFVELVKD